MPWEIGNVLKVIAVTPLLFVNNSRVRAVALTSYRAAYL